ncbi:MAG: HEAT repeat domain-containing protein [Chloroflexi bacterium]|nr:HEAT repeat domain-containing protein [Chloroflexota bacterium]
MPLFKPNIANLKARRDITGLVQALTIRDPDIRHAAAVALGELKATKAVAAIVGMLLASDSTRGERIAAATALGKIGDESTIDALAQASETSREREHASIDAALESRDPKYRHNLYVNRISADEFELRAAIAQAIGHIGGGRAIQALAEMLAAEKGAMEGSVKQSIRSAMSTAAAKSDSLPAICQSIKHPSAEVRYWAANCLAEFNVPTAIDALLRVAYDENENFDVRQIALMGLGRIGDARVIPYIEDLQDDANHGIARDAKQCLMAIRGRLPRRTIE